MLPQISLRKTVCTAKMFTRIERKECVANSFPSNHRIVCSDKSVRSSYESGEIICRLVVEQRGLHHTNALKDALPSIPPLKRIAEKGPRMVELVMIMMERVIYVI